MRHKDFSFIFVFVLLLLFEADDAFATQAHSDPEGIHTHQFSHLFFMVSMGILIYWLRARNLIIELGWKYIQYSAFFFILWTLDAFTVHLLDEQLQVVTITKIDAWKIRIDNVYDSNWMTLLYYIIKLDHLLCVPALFFLYKGLKLLWRCPNATGNKVRQKRSE
jgi:hypothetical protein